MPSFTFEKLSPPAPGGPIPSLAAEVAVRKPRGVIVQMLDRFVEARVKRTVLSEKRVMISRERKSPD